MLVVRNKIVLFYFIWKSIRCVQDKDGISILDLYLSKFTNQNQSDVSQNEIGNVSFKLILINVKLEFVSIK